MTDYGQCKMSFEEQKSVMSDAYWQLWNDEEQARIDSDIEKNRKADASVKLDNIPAGTEVTVEQVSHEFIFGAHIFNFDQLGTDERNKRYRELYGSLFNSATIAFYWKKFELEKGKPRFQGEYRDTAEYWNTVAEPKKEIHWRRPATDPVVEFCESKGIRLHGHTMVWGNMRWNTPLWMHEQIPEQYRVGEDEFGVESFAELPFFKDFTPQQVAQVLPEYTRELNTSMAKRIIELSTYYKDRIHSWDIVNESAGDIERGVIIADDELCKSRYGLMPGDYPYRSLKIAEAYLPDSVKININDYNLTETYRDQVKELLDRNCDIDIMGAQMHLFNPNICLEIAEGSTENQTPEKVRKYQDTLSEVGLPIHMSEITITSPGGDDKGEAIQAMIMRNLYRLWFSHEKTMGITWWNVVDDCGAPGEPSVSGLFHRDMTPKMSYYAMNDLINKEWKTNLKLNSGKDGLIEFRGFKGKYKLSWTDKDGKAQTQELELS